MTADRWAVRRYASFDHHALGAERWNAVSAAGRTRSIFQEWLWQRCWWDSFGRGELLLTTVEDREAIRVIAPIFIDGGMAFLVGAGASDYLDLIGQSDHPEVMELLLRSVIEHCPELVGFRFYLVPDSSPTGGLLRKTAAGLGFECHDEGSIAAPVLDFVGEETARAAAGRTSLVRHERRLQREGRLVVHHFRNAEDILPRLDAFFAQHEKRWAGTPFPSQFLKPEQRAFYRRMALHADESGFLRFTVVEWNDEPIAFHFGFCHGGTFLWYKPSFAIEHARRSPGEILLRHLILAAAEEGASRFDFGIGDERFKSRFANRIETVRTWGLYPRNHEKRCASSS